MKSSGWPPSQLDQQRVVADRVTRGLEQVDALRELDVALEQLELRARRGPSVLSA